MPEATPPPPDPTTGEGPTDPTAAPATPTPAPWTPPDPLAAPQPWAPPAPWTPNPWSPTPWSPAGTPGTSGAAGTPGGSGTSDGPPAASPHGQPGRVGSAPPGHPGPPPLAGPAAHPGAPAMAGRPDPAQASRPAVPPMTPPGPGHPPTHPWPGYATAPWPPPGYPPPYAPPGAAPVRRSDGRITAIVIAVATVVVLVFCGCLSMGMLGSWYGDPSGDSYDGQGYGEPDGGTTVEAPFPVPSRHPATEPSGGPGRLTVVYEVTGAGPVDLQYYDANGDYIENERVSSPWRLRFTTNRTDRGLMVLAQLSAPNEIDRATCRIIVDGKVVAEDSGVYGGDCFG